jgi:hypothetical protein
LGLGLSVLRASVRLIIPQADFSLALYKELEMKLHYF